VLIDLKVERFRGLYNMLPIMVQGTISQNICHNPPEISDVISGREAAFKIL
jgi:hypothetical protein